MTLREQVLKAAAFNQASANEAADNHRSYHAGQSEHQAIRSMNTFLVGASYEQARLSPLIEALAICANALERRNLNSPTGSDTAALAKLETLLKDVK